MPSLQEGSFISEIVTEIQLEGSSTCSNVLMCKELLSPYKKNLLVLDIDGILVDITSDYKYQQYVDFKISGKLGFVEFLTFCFANFEVGVLASRMQKVRSLIYISILYRSRHIT